MKPTNEVLLVRAYVTESRARLKRLLSVLRDSGRINGVTAYRGIAGFGTSTPEDTDPSEPTDPPVVIEFFETPDRVDESVRFLKTLVAPHHIIVIKAEAR